MFPMFNIGDTCSKGAFFQQAMLVYQSVTYRGWYLINGLFMAFTAIWYGMILPGTLPETKSLPLNMGGWEKILSFWKNWLFSGGFRGGTLQGTKISPKNGILKMIFLFPRWDMLIPWRVNLRPPVVLYELSIVLSLATLGPKTAYK